MHNSQEVQYEMCSYVTAIEHVRMVDKQGQKHPCHGTWHLVVLAFPGAKMPTYWAASPGHPRLAAHYMRKFALECCLDKETRK